MKELLGELELNRVYHQDCLDGMKLIPKKSIDMILCDLPYGTTKCSWDTIIPFEPLWEQYERIIKDNGAIVLTASQPFTTALISSNMKLFRYEWIWKKTKATLFQHANKMPMKAHENICVFYKKLPTYNPQKVFVGIKDNRKTYTKRVNNKDFTGGGLTVQKRKDDGWRFPITVQEFNNSDRTKQYHPTQKPVALFEYLIKTYTNEYDIVLDNCIGSGTTAIAATNLDRKWIGFEIEKKYVEIANKRLNDLKQCNLK